MFTLFLKVLTHREILSVFFSIILIILAGYLSAKKKLLSKHAGQDLSHILLNLIIPCVIISSFMKDLTPQIKEQGLSLFVFSFALYIFLILVLRVFYLGYPKDQAVTLLNMSVFGSTSLFGVPIVQSFFGDLGVMMANIFNIPYRLLIFSYSHMSMSRSDQKETLSLKKVFGNPITMITVLAFLFWLFQDYMPQVQVDGQSYSIFRLDQTAYFLYRPMTYLASMLSPLAWLLIGVQLADLSFKDVFQSKTAWYYSFVKLIVVPLISLLLALLTNALSWTNFDSMMLMTIVIVMAAPTSNLMITYAVSAKRGEEIASSGTLLTTLLAIFVIPCWVVVLKTIGI